MPIPLRAFSSTPHRRTGGQEVKSAEPTARAAELHIASQLVVLLLLQCTTPKKTDRDSTWRVVHNGREA
ncbi:hypothetical protein DyAD56_12715 [Dyella sp. AD56]|nr:hypothetical protein DyAD56_12715 [Dyella sp. AD56]